MESTPKTHNKETDNPIKNWANYLNKHFTKKDRQMSKNDTQKEAGYYEVTREKARNHNELLKIKSDHKWKDYSYWKQEYRPLCPQIGQPNKLGDNYTKLKKAVNFIQVLVVLKLPVPLHSPLHRPVCFSQEPLSPILSPLFWLSPAKM